MHPDRMALLKAGDRVTINTATSDVYEPAVVIIDQVSDTDFRFYCWVRFESGPRAGQKYRASCMDIVGN